MVERQNWPAWRYGPNGEARIFASAGEVPEGWGKHPQPAAAQEKQPDSETELAEARRIAEESRVELAAVQKRFEELRGEHSLLKHEIAQLRMENVRLQEKAAQLPTNAGGSAETPSTRRPRKLTPAPGTPFTPQDETVTLDEGRAERLKVLREAGITISDDATDGDIEEALDWLEKQPKKG